MPVEQRKGISGKQLFLSASEHSKEGGYMNGFEIVCLKCGKKTIIKARKREIWKGMICSNNSINLKLEWGYEEGEFVCVCGNKVKL